MFSKVHFRRRRGQIGFLPVFSAGVCYNPAFFYQRCRARKLKAPVNGREGGEGPSSRELRVFLPFQTRVTRTKKVLAVKEDEPAPILLAGSSRSWKRRLMRAITRTCLCERLWLSGWTWWSPECR